MPPTNDTSEPILINIKALAKLLARSARSIERDNEAGRIPLPMTIGGSKRWRLNEIRAWVRAGCPSRETWQEKYLRPKEPRS